MEQNKINKFEKALDFCINQTRENINETKDKFLSSCSVNLKYEKIENGDMKLYSDWTTSFYTGMIWLCYEITGEDVFKNTGFLHIESFRKRLYNRHMIDHHDIGFLYILSCLMPYKIFRDESIRKICIDSAYELKKRFQKKIGILQQSGSLVKESPMKGRFIVDSLMNIPLLFWAGEVTGDRELTSIASRHLDNVLRYIIKDDFSVYQVCIIDPDTGELKAQTSAQGIVGGSWARGQAWAIYGMAISYRYTGEPKYLETACRCAQYFLDNLPPDGICAWDLSLRKTSDQKDTSAGAVCVCGLLEIADILPISDTRKQQFSESAVKMLEILTDNHLVCKSDNSNGILKNGVYSLPINLGVDECQIWGDYYYMEALVRILKPWNSYWLM